MLLRKKTNNDYDHLPENMYNHIGVFCWSNEKYSLAIGYFTQCIETLKKNLAAETDEEEKKEITKALEANYCLRTDCHERVENKQKAFADFKDALAIADKQRRQLIDKILQELKLSISSSSVAQSMQSYLTATPENKSPTSTRPPPQNPDQTPATRSRRQTY